MMKQDGAVKVAAMGLDVHYKFSSVTIVTAQPTVQSVFRRPNGGWVLTER